MPAILAISFFVLIYVEQPSWEKNKILKKEVAELTVALNEIKGKNGFAQQAIKEYQNISGEKTLIMNALPEEKEGSVLMAEFFEKAKKTGAFLKSIKIGEGTELETEILNKKSSEDSGTKSSDGKEDVVASVFNSQEKDENPYGLKVAENSIELLGSYEEIRDFIMEVEKMNRFLSVDSLEIKKSEGPAATVANNLGAESSLPAEEAILASLTVNTYWMKSQSEEALDIANSQKVEQEGQSPVSAFSGDLVLKSLLSGKFSSETITNFQNSITRDIFQFNNENNQGGVGKNNLF